MKEDLDKLIEWYVANNAKDIPSDNIKAFISGYIMGYAENDVVPIQELFRLQVHFGLREKDEAEESLRKIMEVVEKQ